MRINKPELDYDAAYSKHHLKKLLFGENLSREFLTAIKSASQNTEYTSPNTSQLDTVQSRISELRLTEPFGYPKIGQSPIPIRLCISRPRLSELLRLRTL